jgi:hypothetical protein
MKIMAVGVERRVPSWNVRFYLNYLSRLKQKGGGHGYRFQDFKKTTWVFYRKIILGLPVGN